MTVAVADQDRAAPWSRSRPRRAPFTRRRRIAHGLALGRGLDRRDDGRLAGGAATALAARTAPGLGRRHPFPAARPRGSAVPFRKDHEIATALATLVKLNPGAGHDEPAEAKANVHFLYHTNAAEARA